MISPQSHDNSFKESLEKQLTSIYPPPTAQPIRSRCQKPRTPNSQIAQQQSQANHLQGTNENLPNTTDKREQILTTDEWPYSVHGVIEGKFDEDPFYGTGILIGPNVVLTAAHNIYDYTKKIKASPETMRFRPSAPRGPLPFEEVEVKHCFVPDDYVAQRREDYGILILKIPIGYVTGFFGLACLGEAELKSKTLNITGYPLDKVESKPGTYEMWGMEGSVEELRKEDHISYKIDTAQGQSGSGIFYQEGDEYFVCGVHIGEYESGKVGILLTNQRYKQIYKWIKRNVSRRLREDLGNTSSLIFENQNIDKKCISLLLEYNLDGLKCLNLMSNAIQPSAAKVLVQSPLWDSLLELDLSFNQLGNEGVQLLAANTSWKKLSKLNLSNNQISSEGVEALSANKSWRQLSTLNLRLNRLGNEGIQALVANKSWKKLSILDLSFNNISDEGIYVFTANASWKKLSRLFLDSNKIGAEGAEALANNELWKKLLLLSLNSNQIGIKGAEALANNQSWKQLRSLKLGSNDLGDEGIQALAANTSWEKLLHLDLSWNSIGDPGVEALTKNKSWVNLTKLNLFRNKIGNEGVQALANHTWEKLSHLYLGWNKIDGKGAQELAKNTSWNDLSELILYENEIGDDGAKALANNESWKKLSQLNLGRNKIGGKGAQGLATNISWKNLSKLDLSRNNIDDEGVVALASNKSWSSLSSLDLSQNNIRDEGATAIANNEFWGSLSSLRLDWNKISNRGAQAFAESKSLVNLSDLNLEGNKIDYEGARPLVTTKTLQVNLAWNNIGHKGAQLLWQNSSVASLTLASFNPNLIGPAPKWVKVSQLPSTWEAIFAQDFQIFDKLLSEYKSVYQSLVFGTESFQKLEAFLQYSELVRNHGLDFNNNVNNPEEDNGSTQEISLLSPLLPILNADRNDKRFSALVYVDPNLNFNSNNLSAEGIQFPFKNIFE